VTGGSPNKSMRSNKPKLWPKKRPPLRFALMLALDSSEYRKEMQQKTNAR